MRRDNEIATVGWIAAIRVSPLGATIERRGTFSVGNVDTEAGDDNPIISWGIEVFDGNGVRGNHGRERWGEREYEDVPTDTNRE